MSTNTDNSRHTNDDNRRYQVPPTKIIATAQAFITATNMKIIDLVRATGMHYPICSDIVRCKDRTYGPTPLHTINEWLQGLIEAKRLTINTENKE